MRARWGSGGCEAIYRYTGQIPRFPLVIGQRGSRKETNRGELEILRRNADKGLPCGSQKFIGKLERL